MDYTTWREIHQNPQVPQPPNPNPRSTDPYHPPYSSFHYPYDPSNPNPISLTAPPPSALQRHDLYRGLGLDLGLRRLGVDSYASLSSYSDVHLGIEGHARTGSYGLQHRTVDTGSYGYYSDPMSPNWGVKENVRQYGEDPVSYGAGVSIPSNETKQLVIANPNFTFWANSSGRRHGNSTWNKPGKSMRAKSKIVQSAHCEVCKINCDTKRVLDKHKLGKKHKKNLEKLNKTTPSAQSSVESDNPAIGPQESPDIGDMGKAVDLQKSRKKAPESVEDLETKRRKVLQGGAAAESVRTCAMCNVVCNSETVFNSHLAGQKHTDMMKKQAAGTGMATPS